MTKPIGAAGDAGSLLAKVEGRMLDLGCGERKRGPEYVGVDALDYAEVDIVGDVFDVLERIPSGAVAGVYSAHLFEHVEDVSGLLTEIARVIRPEGELEVVVPHFSNPYYYSDPTHRSQFGLYTFSYLAEEDIFRRRVPRYEVEPEFGLINVRLCFKSPPPFYFRYGVKRIGGILVNLTTWTKEFYEENWCHVFPCYELEFRLIRRPVSS